MSQFLAIYVKNCSQLAMILINFPSNRHSFDGGDHDDRHDDDRRRGVRRRHDDDVDDCPWPSRPKSPGPNTKFSSTT